MQEKNVEFCVTNISSYVKDIFCVLYLTCASSPRMVTTKKDSTHSIELDDKVAKLGLVTELFCSRLNDDEKPVTQFLGSALLDLSQVSLKEYHLTLTDSSSRPTGQNWILYDSFHEYSDSFPTFELSRQKYRGSNVSRGGS